jgi:hypothetical protein
MGASGEPSEADIIFNRASLALAKSQRLIASWLPPKPQQGATSKTEEELAAEDDQLFASTPELYETHQLALAQSWAR